MADEDHSDKTIRVSYLKKAFDLLEVIRESSHDDLVSNKEIICAYIMYCRKLLQVHMLSQ